MTGADTPRAKLSGAQTVARALTGLGATIVSEWWVQATST